MDRQHTSVGPCLDHVFRLLDGWRSDSVLFDWNGQKEGTLACVEGNTSGSSFIRRFQVMLCRPHRSDEQSDAKSRSS